ncbi:mannitol-1-phosphate 5-dehydrogenase [Thermoanaerobacterium sp. DL9XJH110]|uniref:mannitol-1-phosphate 5-dehydrogenase n=1 Tax=Thermoanaerobacterium sp. DL9XJH110 TaxID=3386643 RepID=UPI003BB7E516
MKNAVHFGAGNIGRGFIGLLLSRAGYRVTFVDISKDIIDAVNARGRYTVTLAGEVEEALTVENIRGVLFTDEERVAEAVSRSDIVTTAVGPGVLQRIAPALARGLQLKISVNPDAPLNIIACENMVGASEYLRGEVFKRLLPEEIAALEKSVGFPNAAVDRIVPPRKGDDILAVTVEPYFEWVADRKAFKGPIPEIPGMRAVENLGAYVERKIYTLNTGHAVAAYLGYLRGYGTIGEALKDPAVFETVKGAMEEAGTYLVARFGFSPGEHQKYIEKTLKRFVNPALKDEVVRVGRQPLRKLGPEDRLVYPAVKAAELGRTPENLARGIAAALKFDYEGDEEARILQDMIGNEGVKKVLEKICGISEKHPLYEVIMKYYRHS